MVSVVLAGLGGRSHGAPLHQQQRVVRSRSPAAFRLVSWRIRFSFSRYAIASCQCPPIRPETHKSGVRNGGFGLRRPFTVVVSLRIVDGYDANLWPHRSREGRRWRDGPRKAFAGTFRSAGDVRSCSRVRGGEYAPRDPRTTFRGETWEEKARGHIPAILSPRLPPILLTM
jgi:hypothetical protein